MHTVSTTRQGAALGKGHEGLIEDLNRMLAQEYACMIRYSTHAAVVTGPYSEGISKRLLEIASDEAEHAHKLRDRICALGGTPVMKIETEDLIPARTLAEILEVNIMEELKAIESYSKIFSTLRPIDAILHAAIEEILGDEQEHMEELMNLRSTE